MSESLGRECRIKSGYIELTLSPTMYSFRKFEQEIEELLDRTEVFRRGHPHFLFESIEEGGA